MKRRYRDRLARWIDKRVPAAASVTLDRRRIFIFPSRVGFFFFASLLIMLIAAINYENNMSYALTFLLATLFVVAVLHTYANLSGLTVQGVEGGHGFPGDVLSFPVQLGSGGLSRYALMVRWWDQSLGDAEIRLDVPVRSTGEARLFVRARQRGPFRPGRLLIESRYPLGLLRCWTWTDLGLGGLVYPSPQRHPDASGNADRGLQGRLLSRPGEDEFYGLREYRKGDRPRQVYWKGLARGQSLQSKQYSAYVSDDDWLDWESYPGVPTEQRLSYLCYQCLQLHGLRQQYGLKLPGCQLNPSSGAVHRDRVLTALALHGTASA